jgi:hypothetical protein
MPNRQIAPQPQRREKSRGERSARCPLDPRITTLVRSHAGITERLPTLIFTRPQLCPSAGKRVGRLQTHCNSDRIGGADVDLRTTVTPSRSALGDDSSPIVRMNTGAPSAAIVSATSFICDVQMMGKSLIPTTDARQAIEDASKPGPLLCAGAHSALAAPVCQRYSRRTPGLFPPKVQRERRDFVIPQACECGATPRVHDLTIGAGD